VLFYLYISSLLTSLIVSESLCLRIYSIFFYLLSLPFLTFIIIFSSVSIIVLNFWQARDSLLYVLHSKMHATATWLVPGSSTTFRFEFFGIYCNHLQCDQDQQLNGGNHIFLYLPNVWLHEVFPLVLTLLFVRRRLLWVSEMQFFYIRKFCRPCIVKLVRNKISYHSGITLLSVYETTILSFVRDNKQTNNLNCSDSEFAPKFGAIFLFVFIFYYNENAQLIYYVCIVTVFPCIIYTPTSSDSGPGSSVSIVTELRVGRSGIESRWGRDFSALPDLHLGPTQPPVKWVPGLSLG